MYSCPGTCAGHGSSWSSRTWTLCPVIAVPYGMLDQAGSRLPISWRIDQIEPSVAPPRLTIRHFGARSRSRPGRFRGIQSPLSRHTRRLSSIVSPGGRLSRSRSISTGTEFHTVTCSARARAVQAAGSWRWSRVGTTRVAPAARVPNRSQTARSNVDGDTASTASVAPMAKRSLTSRTVLSAPWWEIMTPLGRPVEPEV